MLQGCISTGFWAVHDLDFSELIAEFHTHIGRKNWCCSIRKHG